MLSSAQNVSPKPAALPPAAQPAPGTKAGPSFAQFLNEQPDLQPTPGHADPVPTAPDTANEATAAPATTTNTPPARRREGNASSAKPATPTPSRAPETAAASARQADETKTGDADSEPVDAETAVDRSPETAGLSEFTQLIGLVVPTPQAVATALPAAPATETGSDTEPAGKVAGGAHAARLGRLVDEDARDAAPRGGITESVSGAATASPTERRTSDAPARAGDALRAKGIELAADKATAARSASADALQAAPSSPGEAGPLAATAPAAMAPSFAAMLAQQALPSAAANGEALPAPATGRVHAALQSNAFGPELAASVSLLAVDGVQSAELQLNPADMGPVAVQIVIDGSQAQVSFHAAQAETRQALEQSLPDLAAALQGQGLTLSGGGVFQQSSRDAQGGDAETGNADGRGSRADARGGRVGSASAAVATVHRAVGLLDTFA